jgi:hypothetical protein
MFEPIGDNRQMNASDPQPTRPRRLRREARTVELMIGLYCRRHHKQAGRPAGIDPSGLCPGCATLFEYARRRIEECRFGAEKPTCARCTVHCFRPSLREDVRRVMRYSGPRMTVRHPYLALRHLLDRR